MKHPNLIPECNVDTAFVEMLGYKGANHAPGITEVSNILERKMVNQTAFGFVDGDKKQPKYFNNFIVIKTTTNAKLLKHLVRNHYLVMVNPDMDRFIYNICRKLSIDLPKYGFPSELGAFTTFTKKPAIKNDTQFKNLLNTINQRNPEELQAIKSWMRKFFPYN